MRTRLFEIRKISDNSVLYEGVQFTDKTVVLRRTDSPGDHTRIYPAFDSVLVLDPLLRGWGKLVWIHGDIETVEPIFSPTVGWVK